jgi:hypothetical protein
VRPATAARRFVGFVAVVLPEVAWVNRTDKGASTIRVSVPGRMLPGSVVVLATVVAALATSTAVTVGW